MPINSAQIVNDFMDGNGKFNETRYKRLLGDVVVICNTLKAEMKGQIPGSFVIKQVYSREDKQSGNPFKTRPKMAKALDRLRRTEPGANPTQIDDVIGITVVVHYPDEICLVRERLLHRMAQLSAIEHDKPVDSNGYRARHIVFQSNVPRHAPLRCEVQIKTMLHNSWAQKTHDLNYKPQGQIDQRLADMMQGFGHALQSIEVQSQLLRTLILERWNAEVERRALVRKLSFDVLPIFQRNYLAFSPAATLLYDQIRQDDGGSPRSPDQIAEFFKQISGLASASPREMTWLSLLLARISSDQEHLEVAGMQTHELLRRADLLTSGQIDKDEISYLPLALSACGDLQGAIDQSEYLLTGRPELDEDVRRVVKFNLANFLVENACFGSPLNGDEAAAASARISSLLKECAEFNNHNASAFLDLEAMTTVAFSSSPPALRAAIDLLYGAKQKAIPEEEEIAAAYFELHVRVAWRKLLELEPKTSGGSPSLS